jgi:hypothetical protein
MSSSTSNNAARRRRAKPIDTRPNELNQPSINNNTTDNNKSNNSFIPIYTTKESIYVLNHRQCELSKKIINIENNMETRNLKLDETINNTVKSSGVKYNILESEILELKNKLSSVEEIINQQNNYIRQMQSMTVYNNNTEHIEGFDLDTTSIELSSFNNTSSSMNINVDTEIVSQILA